MNIKIGDQYQPFIVAEMSGNHNGSLERALSIVDAAADAGAHAVKIQTYTADTMTLNINRDEFVIRDPKSLWYGRSLYDLYEEAHTPWDWHAAIFERCKEKGLIGFSTPFDATAVDFLETFDVPIYKVASLENTDLPLIEKIASTGKIVIISTGTAIDQEIKEAVETATKAGASKVILTKCTSAYPCGPQDLNLSAIPVMKQKYGVEVGFSDHTIGAVSSVAAVALGAVLIEKHFTLARKDGGVDSAFSLEPSELKDLIAAAKEAWLARGKPVLETRKAEESIKDLRRSLYACVDIKKGEIFNDQNIKSIRPGKGLAPKYYPQLIGRVAKCDIQRGTPLQWDCVEGGGV